MKQPDFYCETCGHKVGAYEDECPHCGMPFYGVRCPQCGFNGKARQFVNGCPKCGYKAAANETDVTPNHSAASANSTESSLTWLVLFIVLLFGIVVAAVVVLMLL